MESELKHTLYTYEADLGIKYPLLVVTSPSLRCPAASFKITDTGNNKIPYLSITNEWNGFSCIYTYDHEAVASGTVVFMDLLS